MASDNPMMCCPVVVNDTNKHIDFQNETSLYTATVATGTYYDVFSLASAAQTAMETAYGTAGITVSVLTTSTPIGKVKILFGVAFTDPSLLWASGTNAATTFCSLLGFSASADDTGDNEYTSDNQAPNAWWSSRPPSSDTFDRREHIGGQTRRVLDGTATKRLTVATPRKRRVEFARIAPALVLERSATGTNTNRAFETLWNTIVSGGDAQRIRYFADQTVSGTYTDYYIQEPLDLLEALRREDIDVETYAWAMTLLRKES